MGIYHSFYLACLLGMSSLYMLQVSHNKKWSTGLGLLGRAKVPTPVLEGFHMYRGFATQHSFNIQYF